MWDIKRSFTDNFDVMFVIDNQILLKQALARRQMSDTKQCTGAS